MNKLLISATCLTLLFNAGTRADEDYVYLFGYGSLMFTDSRTVTVPDPEDAVYLPAKLRGMERRWNLWAAKKSTRVLGLEVSSDLSKFTNGLLFPVKKSQLTAYDRREGSAYNRVQVQMKSIEFYREEHREQIISKGKAPVVYTYVAIKGLSPYTPKSNNERPISTYYLDIVRSGCIEVDENNKLMGAFINDCAQSLGLDGYNIHNERDERSFPEVELQKAKEKVKKFEDLQKNKWPEYIDKIEITWGK